MQAQHNRLLTLYRTMARIRCFEEAAEQALADGLITGAVHLSIGQEAIPAGICANLTESDLLTSNHRGHGHTLAKGASPEAMMSELFGRASGACSGKGGSMHIADFGVGMLGANGVVGAGILVAAGAAHGIKLRNEKRVVVCFFGDGALNRGPFLEGLNWAKVFELPVLFVCEDNGFAASTRTRELSAGPGPSERAVALGFNAHLMDGNDVAAVDETAGELIRGIRNGAGAQLLVVETYRLKGHTCTDDEAYRTRAEVDAAAAREPMVLCRARLQTLGVTDQVLDGITDEAREEMAAAVSAAKAAPYPEPRDTYVDVQDVGSPLWPG